MWKKDNNLPVKIPIFVPVSFINWMKSCAGRSSSRSTRVINAFIVRALHKSHAFIHACTRNTESVHCAHWFWRSLFMPCWLVINGFYDRLASNQKHPYIASMYEYRFNDKPYTYAYYQILKWKKSTCWQHLDHPVVSSCTKTDVILLHQWYDWCWYGDTVCFWNGKATL